RASRATPSPAALWRCAPGTWSSRSAGRAPLMGELGEPLRAHGVPDAARRGVAQHAGAAFGRPVGNGALPPHVAQPLAGGSRYGRGEPREGPGPSARIADRAVGDPRVLPTLRAL